MCACFPTLHSSETIAVEIPGHSLNHATSWTCSKVRLTGEKAKSTIMSNFYISKLESVNVTFLHLKSLPITIAYAIASICSYRANWIIVPFTINPICAKTANSTFKFMSSEPLVIYAFLIFSNHNVSGYGWFTNVLFPRLQPPLILLLSTENNINSNLSLLIGFCP